MVAPTYKLVYFNARGVAEPIRFILAFGKIEYEDVRIEKADWPELKAKQPFGKLPVLEIDGTVFAESQAISRYLAKEIGIAGKTNLESALCDMLTDGLRDCLDGRRVFMFEEDVAKQTELKAKFFNGAVPECLTNLEAFLNKNGGTYFVGDALTWADLAIAYALQELKGFEASVLEKFSLLEEHVKRIHGLPAIKDWVEKRPQTDF